MRGLRGRQVRVVHGQRRGDRLRGVRCRCGCMSPSPVACAPVPPLRYHFPHLHPSRWCLYPHRDAISLLATRAYISAPIPARFRLADACICTGMAPHRTAQALGPARNACACLNMRGGGFSLSARDTADSWGLICHRQVLQRDWRRRMSDLSSGFLLPGRLEPQAAVRCRKLLFCICGRVRAVSRWQTFALLGNFCT